MDPKKIPAWIETWLNDGEPRLECPKENTHTEDTGLSKIDPATPYSIRPSEEADVEYFGYLENNILGVTDELTTALSNREYAKVAKLATDITNMATFLSGK